MPQDERSPSSVDSSTPQLSGESVPHSTTLPVSNPDCTHVWEQLPNECAHRCVRCHYTVTELERQRQHEGETDTGRRRRFEAR